MITVAGALLGIALVRHAAQREPWLRAAMLAQVADLVTFAAVWEHAQGELNPLGGLVRVAASQVLGLDYHGPAIAVAAIVLSGLKVALIAFLVRINGDLGRYRRLVMGLAATAGAIGAASNLAAHANAGGTLLVVALYAAVAIRWPLRYRDAVGAGARLSAAVLLGFGGLAADSYLRWVARGYECGFACAADLVPFLLGLVVALYGFALLALWATLLFSARFLPRRVGHAD